MKEDGSGQKLEELEKRKEALLVKYLQLQDKVDHYNEEIYKVCCEIETLNAEITAEKENHVKNNGSKVSNQEQKTGYAIRHNPPNSIRNSPIRNS